MKKSSVTLLISIFFVFSGIIVFYAASVVTTNFNKETSFSQKKEVGKAELAPDHKASGKNIAIPKKLIDKYENLGVREMFEEQKKAVPTKKELLQELDRYKIEIKELTEKLEGYEGSKDDKEYKDIKEILNIFVSNYESLEQRIKNKGYKNKEGESK